MEIAFVSSNRMLAEMQREKHGFAQKITDVFYRHPNGFVSTMLVGNNIALVVYGILMARFFNSTIFRDVDPSVAVPANTIISTIIVLFSGEFLPKALFKKDANRWLTFFAPTAYVIYILLWPISKFTTLLSQGILRLVGVKTVGGAGDEGFSKVDLDHLVQTTIAGADNDDEIEPEVELFQNVIEFTDTKVRDCMIPRTELEAVDINDCTLDQLKQKFVDSGHSKIIVYDEDIDHIVGYIHSSEMFRDAADWRNHIHTVPYVPEAMAAQKLMQTLMRQKKSLAVVVDEFGGTGGIVALEDIVEEIFGDIEDEHDSSNLIAEQVADGEYQLSARLEIDKVNEMFQLSLPEADDYMTIAGLILHYHQTFPNTGEVVRIRRFEFRILKKTNTKIELVRLKVNDA